MFCAWNFTSLTFTCTDNLIVDTGSSNTWVGASTPYTPTSTSTDTGEPVVSLTDFLSIGKVTFTFSHRRSRTVPVLSLVSFIIFSKYKKQGTDCASVGEEWLDTVTLGSGLTITDQSIGVAKTSTGFEGVDGIVG